MNILAVESSCDETAIAVVRKNESFEVLANEVASQVELHRPFGGIVPEIAARRHLEVIYQLTEGALKKAGVTLSSIDMISVTQGPGLVGALVVGMSFAKALSFSLGLPLVPVDHIKAHSLAVLLETPSLEFPFVSLVASGGHTALFLVKSPTEHYLLGQTRDDAAGEAFDKVAKLLGLGYPGGPIISKLAEKGNPNSVSLPRPMLDTQDFDFSFSGLKTAVLNLLKQKAVPFKAADICASFQEAVCDVLVEKTRRASETLGVKRIVVSGGVASNQRLRERFSELKTSGFEVLFPSKEFCTDNAAMIAVSGYFEFKKGNLGSLELDVYARSRFKRYSL